MKRYSHIAVLIGLVTVAFSSGALQAQEVGYQGEIVTLLGSGKRLPLPRNVIDKYIAQVDKSSHLMTEFNKKVKELIAKMPAKFFELLGVTTTILGAVETVAGGIAIVASVPSQQVTFWLVGPIIGLNIFMLPAHLVNLLFFSVGAGAVGGLIGAINYGVAFDYMKKLEKEEEFFPGTLTEHDKNIIKVFKNVLKGPIARSFEKKRRLDKALDDITLAFVKNNPGFVQQAGSEKRARKAMRDYILARVRIEGAKKALYPLNLNITWHNYLKYMDIKITWEVIGAYNTKKRDAKTQEDLNALMREQIEYMKGLYEKMSAAKRFAKRLTPGFNVLNAKELALKVSPSYAFAQNALNRDNAFERSFILKYGPLVVGKMKPSIPQYKKALQEITSDLTVDRPEVRAALGQK